MTTNGKHLEALVAFVEKTLLPQGFEVKTNERIYNEDGIQIAEFDIQIRGKLGSTDIAWLIECRDRPGTGPAPVSWIEQLVGRQTRFKFNRVTAVSTTGFAPGAATFAQSENIELREVKTLSPAVFKDWLHMSQWSFIENICMLHSATFLVQGEENDARLEALHKIISNPDPNTALLKSSKTSNLVLTHDAFANAVKQSGAIDDILPNGTPKNVRLRVDYTNNDDHFLIETPAGAMRVRTILFEGELSVRETLSSLSATKEYRHSKTGQPISQLATFDPQKIHGFSVSMELHHLVDSDKTYVLLRKA